jgi:hypothetical protein
MVVLKASHLLDGQSWWVDTMTYKFDISHSESMIQVRVSGTIDGAGIRKLWAAIAEACDSYDCYDILGVSELDEPFSITDAFNHHEIFTEVGITLRHRIAWVNVDTESREILKFTETVLVNRSKLNGGLFPSTEEARLWLQRRDDSQA